MRELAERRQIARLFAGVLLLGAAAAFVSCGSADTEADADSGSSSGSSSSVALTWDARSLQESESDAPFSTSILPTSVAVGPSRMLFALIDRAQGTLVSGATITARYYRLAADPEKEPDVSEEYATTDVISRTLDLRGVAGDSTSPVNDADLTTVYSTTATFDAPGYWGVSLEITVGDETYRPRMKFWVLEATPEIAVGAPAPRSEQATLADVADAVAVSSQPEPNEAMLDQTVAAALDSGKPVVVASHDGPSMAWGHDGRLLGLAAGAKAGLTVAVAAPSDWTTPYARFGPRGVAVVVATAWAVLLASAAVRRAATAAAARRQGCGASGPHAA